MKTPNPRGERIHRGAGHHEPRSHASRVEVFFPVWGLSIFPPVPGSPRSVTARGRGCPLILQCAAHAYPTGTVWVSLRAPKDDTRVPSPGRCRSAALAVSYRVCRRRRRNERAESGPGRARPGAPTRAAGDWLSPARLQRQQDGAGPGRGGTEGRSSVRKLRLPPELANSRLRTTFLTLRASVSSYTKGTNSLKPCP